MSKNDRMEEIAETLHGWMLDTRKWIDDIHTSAVDGEQKLVQGVNILSEILQQLKEGNERLERIEAMLRNQR